MIYRKTFTQADLDVDNVFVHTHSLNTESVLPTLYDNNGTMYPITDIFNLGDDAFADKPNKATLSFPDVIAGTWTLLLSYMSVAESTSGRRAFELAEATPTDDYRVILGKALTPSINMTLTNFFALLLTKLGFLKTAQNLNDLVDKNTARSNLGVYSTAQVDSALAGYAALYQVGSGTVLGVANTAIYTPSANYHPATKLYCDSKYLFMGSVGLTGTVTKLSGTISAITGAYADGQFTLTHNYNSLNYLAFVVRNESAGDASQVKVFRGTNTLKVNFNNGSNLAQEFDFIMIKV